MFRKQRGRVEVSLSEVEADVLRKILGEYRELIAAPDSHDPVTRRLFPDASPEVPEVSEQYRGMTLNQLESEKLNNIDLVQQSLGHNGEWKSELVEDQEEAVLKLLTDLRLALGTRLEVTEETMNKPIDPEDPQDWSMAVLHWLGGLQESLINAMSG